MAEIVWTELRCPRCGSGVPLNIMSDFAICACGLFSVDRTPEECGWYDGVEMLERGAKWEAERG